MSRRVVFKWSISRARATADYNVCAVWVDGKKAAACTEAALTAAGVKVDGKSSGLLGACEAALEEIIGLLNRIDTRDIDLESLWPVADQLTLEIAKAKGSAV